MKKHLRSNKDMMSAMIYCVSDPVWLFRGRCVRLVSYFVTSDRVMPSDQIYFTGSVSFQQIHRTTTTTTTTSLSSQTGREIFIHWWKHIYSTLLMRELLNVCQLTNKYSSFFLLFLLVIVTNCTYFKNLHC